MLANALGEQALAMQQIEHSIALYQSIHEPTGAARARNTLGGIAYDNGDLRGAIAQWQQVDATMRAANNLGEVARTVSNIGEALYHLGKFADAEQHYQEGLALAQRSGRVDIEAVALANLGNLARRRGELGQAATLQAKALRLWQQLGERRQIAVSLEHLASIAAAQGRAARTARLLGAAAALRRLIGAPPARPEQAELEQAATTARAAIGEAPWAAAYGAGTQLTLDAALAFALHEAQATEGVALA